MKLVAAHCFHINILKLVSVNFIWLRLFSLASPYLSIALFEQNEGVFIKLGCQ